MSQGAALPIVYSCSGASSAAQMANHIAVKLDRLGVADMSCIAGVGGDVKPLVRTAKSGRPIIALDGCPLHCVAHILKRHGIMADKHYDLSDMGVTKKMHADFDLEEARRILRRIAKESGAMATTPPAEGAGGDVPRPRAAPAVPVGEEHASFASPACYLPEFKDW